MSQAKRASASVAHTPEATVLFNSFPFIFAFLPVVLVGFLVLARVSERLAAGWLTVASLYFYAWWDVRYVALLLASICFNFVLGSRIARQRESRGPQASKRLLIAGIVEARGCEVIAQVAHAHHACRGEHEQPRQG